MPVSQNVWLRMTEKWREKNYKKQCHNQSQLVIYNVNVKNTTVHQSISHIQSTSKLFHKNKYSSNFHYRSEIIVCNWTCFNVFIDCPKKNCDLHVKAFKFCIQQRFGHSIYFFFFLGYQNGTHCYNSCSHFGFTVFGRAI